MAKSQSQQMNEVGFDGPRTAWRGHWSMNLLLSSHERARSGYEMAPFTPSFFWFSSPSPRSLFGQRRKSEPMPPARGNFKLIDLAQGNLRAATSSLPKITHTEVRYIQLHWKLTIFKFKFKFPSATIMGNYETRHRIHHFQHRGFCSHYPSLT